MTRDKNEIIITEEESKQCKICNKVFGSNRLMIWHVRKEHNLDFENYIINTYYEGIRPVCLKTGNKLSFKAHKLGPYFSNYSKNNFPRKPHTEESKVKIKEGCEKNAMEKFGVKNVFETDWCKEKSKNTLMERYGVENIMQLDEMRNKAKLQLNTEEAKLKSKETSLLKYNSEYYRGSEIQKIKSRKTNFEFYYKDWSGYLTHLDDISCGKLSCLGTFEDILNNTPLKFKCNVCENIWSESFSTSPSCGICRDKFENARSVEESSLMKWIKETIPHNFTPNKRFNINGKVYEADICFDDLKLIIELNGLYWHSEKAGKDKNYHINKLNSLESIGYNVIQIFEDEWLFKTNLVKSKLLHRLKCNTIIPKIYARNCIIKKITNKECKDFINNTHIQGHVNSTFCYGAYYNNELISIMTFSLPRINMGNKDRKDGEYELVRFSTSNNYRIIGIASKLLNHFIKEVKPIKIISYADKRWTSRDNNLYKTIGFKLIGETQPNYWYVKKYKREYRFNYTKQKLIEMGYDSSKTEWEIMEEIGYNRIWDCGHFKYEMMFENKTIIVKL